MEPKLPKIKPNIQPNKIVRANKGVYGGVKSTGVSPLVRNITGSDNLFSKLQEKNPEVRNKRGTRTLFNMLGTFGTERNEKIIRKNLQLLRNTLVETFEIAKLLRMNAAMSDGEGGSGGGLNMGLIAGIGAAGGLGLLSAVPGAGLIMGIPKLLEDIRDTFKGGGDDDDPIKTFIDDETKEFNKEFPKVEEYTDEKLNSDLDKSSKQIIDVIDKSSDSLIKNINKLVEGEGINVEEEEKTDNTLQIKEEDSKDKNVDSLVDGIENSFKDQLKGKIAEGESNTDYGAMYSRDREGFERGDEDITKMTISEVDKLQTDYLNYQTSIGRGDDRSAAMGAYQMLNPKKVAEMMDLDPETTVFDKKTQDMMSEYYLNYSGLKEFEAGEITAEEFNNRLAEQFASIKTTSGEGVYDTDKMNKANTSVLDLIKSQESKYKDQDLGTFLKGRSKGEVIIIDNTKDMKTIESGTNKKTSTVINMNKGKTKFSGPDLVFLPSSDPDSTNITTKSILGVIG